MRIVDTRKTAPLFREPQRRAVCVGGGNNHRFALFDGILIKDNHTWWPEASGQRCTGASGCPPPASNRGGGGVVAQAVAAVDAGADVVMLDTMDDDAVEKHSARGRRCSR